MRRKSCALLDEPDDHRNRPSRSYAHAPSLRRVPSSSARRASATARSLLTGGAGEISGLPRRGTSCGWCRSCRSSHRSKIRSRWARRRRRRDPLGRVRRREQCLERGGSSPARSRWRRARLRRRVAVRREPGIVCKAVATAGGDVAARSAAPVVGDLTDEWRGERGMRRSLRRRRSSRASTAARTRLESAPRRARRSPTGVRIRVAADGGETRRATERPTGSSHVEIRSDGDPDASGMLAGDWAATSSVVKNGLPSPRARTSSTSLGRRRADL